MGRVNPTAFRRWPNLLMFLGAAWLLLAVGLALYQQYYPATVRIEWDTATEVETAGFFLYRSDSPEGEFTPVNEQLIPSEGDPLSGAAYSYIDDDVLPGETYYYMLEEIEYDAGKNLYQEEMFSYTVPHTWWLIVLSAVSAVVGLALLVKGVRESSNS